ncbi:MAG: hypothetical protein HY298_27120 [Verrucomicrobia bacterium]|nr:hypothetical protein [Verrucomicrobiota bacterium]
MKTSTHLFITTLLAGFTFAAPGASAQVTTHPKPARLLPGLGRVHHPVSTKSGTALRYFDQGLALVFAFNHEAAVRSFKRAAEYDPDLAMAQWGIALALGPNINLDVDPEREKAAYEAAQQALSLAAKAPEHERAYIEALTKRYSIDPKADLKKLAVDFKNAMGEVSKRYPDDLDAATLYAESAMDLRPWQLWSADGKPAEGTEEIVAVLESVLRREPDHLGANHYYIHAVEASPHPERALPCAQRLESLAPAAGHLVHMPAHIYMRVGDYAAAARRNEFAATADQEYIQTCGVQGVYPMLYYSHNLHFLAIAHGLQGRFADAKRAADKLAAHVGPHVKEIPLLEGFMPTPTLILVMFGRWNDILRSPEPAPEMKTTTALWHFARGMAAVSTGKLEQAQKEHQALVAAKSAIPPEAMYGPLNRVSDILKIADGLLGAKIAVPHRDTQSAIALLEQAAQVEDSLNYTEPPDWYIYSREALGSVLLANRDYIKAEKVFRDDLERNPRKGRALFGLYQSLKAQGKNDAAQSVRTEFETAWKNADTTLRAEETFWNNPTRLVLQTAP